MVHLKRLKIQGVDHYSVPVQFSLPKHPAAPHTQRSQDVPIPPSLHGGASSIPFYCLDGRLSWCKFCCSHLHHSSADLLSPSCRPSCFPGQCHQYCPSGASIIVSPTQPPVWPHLYTEANLGPNLLQFLLFFCFLIEGLVFIGNSSGDQIIFSPFYPVFLGNVVWPEFQPVCLF